VGRALPLIVYKRHIGDNLASRALLTLRSREQWKTMEKVLGFGGVFFRAQDPVALAAWYRQHLGITPAPSSYEESPWQEKGGPSGFAPFPEDTAYFGDPKKAWMVNFRVRDLDAMVAQLQGAGIAVTINPEVYPNGRFARLHDPEGNPIELWQPAGQGALRTSTRVSTGHS